MSLCSMSFELNGLQVTAVFKGIKHLHIRVLSPAGEVRVSAPMRMPLGTIRGHVLEKMGWIKKQQAKLQAQACETSSADEDCGGRYFNGKRYLLKIIEREAVPQVQLLASELHLHVRPNSSEAKKQAVLDAWYRQQLRLKINEYLPLWEKKMQVSVAKVTVRKMKTLWGSCTPDCRSIRMNLELAKKPPECFEYVLVHELVHLLEASHNHRFVALMDEFLPTWRQQRDALNALPIRREHWPSNDSAC